MAVQKLARLYGFKVQNETGVIGFPIDCPDIVIQALFI